MKEDYACADWEKVLQIDPNYVAARNNLDGEAMLV
jgi:hypothetical protein